MASIKLRVDGEASGNERRLTPAQEAELAGWVEAGPGSVGLDHLARWRCLDLQALILERWGVDYHERTIGKLLERLEFSHRQDEAALEAFKETSRKGSRRSAASNRPAPP